MSRAIALDGFLQRSLDRDERRFTLNEAAREFAEMGYRLQRSEPQVWTPPRYGEPRTFEAELRTACGCTKRIFMQAPSDRTIRISLVTQSVSAYDDSPAKMSFAARDFIRHSDYYRRDEHGTAVFEYREIL